jgi:hypothetical protein
MTIADTILTYAPLFTAGPIVIGTFTIWSNIATARRTRFIKAWAEFAQTEDHGRIRTLAAANERDLVFDTPTRIAALNTLSALERLARQASASRTDWEMVLPLDIHAALKSFVALAKPQTDVVRKTDVPLEVRCYNGDRSSAFANVLSSFR